MKKLNQKKGQIEIVGLVMIVILVTLGLLFLVTFSLKPKEKSLETTELLISSTMAALMQTEVYCNYSSEEGSSVLYLSIEKELLEDCAVNHEGGYKYFCDNQPSCTFLNKTIRNLLNKTLGTWHWSYEFKAYLLETEYPEEKELFLHLKDEKGKGCPKERVSDYWRINTERGLVESVLYLCS